MALTRITGTVIADNAISADKIANAVITTAMIAPGAITADKLNANTATGGPTSGEIVRVNTNLTANINSVQTNVVAAEANVTAIKDSTTDLNIGSGKYFFDKSGSSLGISNITPFASSITIGTTANIILRHNSKGGNVLIGTNVNETKHRLDVRGSANALVFRGEELTAATALVSSADKGIISSAVTSTELAHLDGVTSPIQTQLTAKAALAGATFTGDVNMNEDLTVHGDFTVHGSTTTVNAQNSVFSDQFIALASNLSHGSATSADQGVFVNRGSAGNAVIYYDQTSVAFRLSETKDPTSNVDLSPIGDANLIVNNVAAESMLVKGADLATMISDNRSGAVSTVFATNLTASRALVSDGSGKISISAITSTEIGHLDGVSSAIQTQIDAKDSQSNAFNTYTKLNANINIVQDNVASIAGGALILKPFSNSNTQAAGSTANTFFIGTAMPGDALANISFVTLDGIVQQKDVPSGTFAANNDYIVNAVAAHASIKFTRVNIPVGTKVNISVFRAV